jgi:hypothetical protein
MYHQDFDLIPPPLLQLLELLDARLNDFRLIALRDTPTVSAICGRTS